MSTARKKILTINSGSSSIKFSLYSLERGAEDRLLSGKLDRVGLEGGRLAAFAPDGGALIDTEAEAPGHDAALRILFDWLCERPEGQGISGAGHRVVHGGSVYTRPHRIGPALLDELLRLTPFATEHLPHEIKAIEAVAGRFPALPQFACFDTSFHRTMPEAAATYPLPLELRDEGIVRWGFHGLSYEYIVSKMTETDKNAGGRMVAAHLGNGASMAAIKDGVSVDTTMGFTPAAGLMMSTRCGDIDPGILVYLMKEKGMGADGLNELLNKKSGLLGVSGISPAMEDLLRSTEARAALAVEIFCRQARKFIAALSTVLGGLDTLVFTGGMGENSPEVRRRICEGLEFMGVRVDAGRNEAGAEVISAKGSPVAVRVIKTDEELMIARHAGRLLEG
ncbi:MAG: acetate/propionate family kinase [Deltaproteobacteria bacterium]|nr:acetate/propionate family kinase [Deltaproteobacteria bacterium]